MTETSGLRLGDESAFVLPAAAPLQTVWASKPLSGFEGVFFFFLKKKCFLLGLR